MSKRGRKPLLVPTVAWKCQIPENIAAKIDLFLLDPIRGVPIYGARSELVTRLLREYLATVTGPEMVDKLEAAH